MIGLLLGGMLLFSHTSRTLTTQLEIKDQLIDNAYSGIAYAEANFKEIKPGQVLKMRLFNEGIDSVSISKESWGAFTILRSTATHKNVKFSKISLSGLISEDDKSLYLPDYGRPLSVAGQTRLENNCYLPKTGVKRAYIEGKNYVGSKLVYGGQHTSTNALPEIDPVILDEVTKLNGQFQKWEQRDSIKNSFANPGLHFIDDNFLSLEDEVVEGHVILEARDSIFIGAQAELSDIIIKAPVVYIESGFEGNLQIIATEKITLENNVLLRYPSVLSLIETTFPKTQNAQISIGKQSQVLGTVLALSQVPNFRKPVQLSIAEEAEVDGLVYCKGKTELKGTINGTIYTEKFYLKTLASSYENHLLDATIKNDLPKEFVTVDLFRKSKNLTTIAWLN